MATSLEQFKTSIGNISLGRKIAALLIIAGSIAGLTIFTLWANKQEMSVLYSNLSAEDAGAVIAKLKEQKIPYEIGEMGSSVLVPSDKVHELRLNLAGQGLPQGGGVGFEIFDRTTMGMTDFVQKLNYKRALQGELA
ncbi:MAG: flagellar M-ring protein FliF, partial [Nitrospirota bacterium]